MKEFLENHDKIAILAIGNEIKGDDGLGPFMARKLSALFQNNKNVAVFDGGTVPENYTGSVRDFDPTHIILIDAVEMGEENGYIRVVKKEEIYNYNISTHSMPISFLIKYMESTIGSKIILVGIQPKSMGLAEGISKEVDESVEEVISTLQFLIGI